MCDVCAATRGRVTRRGLVRLAGLGAGSAALVIAGLHRRRGALARQDEATPPATDTHSIPWSYEGEDGPERWGELDPVYATCSRGVAQSPVDITRPVEADLGDLEFAYRPISPLPIVNNGHTIQVNVPAGQSVTVDGTSYELRQFHFHAPSEHTIDGRAQAMELHLVHVAADETIAVVGLLLAEGEDNAALQPVFAAMPETAGPEHRVPGSVDLAALLPAVPTTYRYLGSLTTPPCAEGVQWLLFTEPGQISAAQLAAFRKINGSNARPVQPLNVREVEEDTSA